jgi:hypothetical protein
MGAAVDGDKGKMLFGRSKTMQRAAPQGGQTTVGRRLVINQDSDILYVITGFKKILNDALGIQVDEKSKASQQLMLSTGMIDPTLMES